MFLFIYPNFVFVSSRQSSMVSMAACYQGGPGFKSRQGQEFFNITNNMLSVPFVQYSESSSNAQIYLIYMSPKPILRELSFEGLAYI